MEVEFDIPRARGFLAEAKRLADELSQSVVELDWGRSLLARWDGDLAEAQTRMRRALTLARLREDRWRELECLVWLAKMAMEDSCFVDAAARCDEIDTVAAHIGNGPAPVAEALRAVARLSNGADEFELELEALLAALRALDDKAQLAYLLNTIAACRLERGRWASARDAAEEALAPPSRQARHGDRRRDVSARLALTARDAKPATGSPEANGGADGGRRP